MTHAANVKTDLPAFEKFGRTINPSQDPTKTAGLRARWVAQVRKRWSEVQKFVRQSVVTEDFFGLKRDTPPGNPSQQIERFMAALVRVEKTTISEEKGGFIPWITPFVGEGFGKGMVRGNRDLAALARGQKREARTSTGNALRLVTNAAELFEAPTLDPNNLQDALQAGERARLFEMEVTRTWQGITGVTAQVNAQVAQLIATALETRATPRQLAKDINDRIDKVGKTRSEMIARTETVAANNRGAVAEFAEAQRLTGFEVHVQWETSLDSRVRDTHIVRHGDVYTKEAGLGLISEPNCRCALLPYIPAIEGEVDLSSGKAAKALTPKQAEKPAAKERKKLGLPKGQVGKPVKRRKPEAKPEVKPAPKPKAAPKPKPKKKPVAKPAPDSLTKEQQVVIGNFDGAPDDLKAAVARSKRPDVELLDVSEGSSYNKKTNVLRTVRDNSTVARHEYGHSLLNNNSDHVGVRSRMTRAINDDLGLLGRSLDIDDKVSIGVIDSDKLAKIGVKNPFKVSRALDTELKEKFPFGLDDNGALHDLFGSVTKNKIGRGHATSYYSGSSGRSLLRMTDEAYANMTTIYASNGPQWEFAKKHLPNLTDAFLESLI